MGLFDTVHATGHCLIPNGSYQTKGLSCDLDHYELRADGSLWRVAALGGDIDPVRWTGTDAIRLYSTTGRLWILLYVRGALIYAGRE
jgi:hypothetical protein